MEFLLQIKKRKSIGFAFKLADYTYIAATIYVIYYIDKQLPTLVLSSSGS